MRSKKESEEFPKDRQPREISGNVLELIKAMRCLASHDNVGFCYADRWNWTHKKEPRKWDSENGVPKMRCQAQTYANKRFKIYIPCPYYQETYGTCYDDGECSEWLNRAADIIEVSVAGQDAESEGS